MDKKIKEVIKLLEEYRNKKVELNEVEFSDKTSFFDFSNIEKNKLSKSKLVDKFKEVEIYEYKRNGVLNYYYVVEEDMVLLAFNVLPLTNGVQIEEIEKNPDYNGNLIKEIISFYEFLLRKYKQVFSGSKQTKGGRYIWRKMFEGGLDIYIAYKYKLKNKINNFQELEEFYLHEDEYYTLCLK